MMCNFGGNTGLYKTEAKLLSGLSLRWTQIKLNFMNTGELEIGSNSAVWFSHIVQTPHSLFTNH